MELPGQLQGCIDHAKRIIWLDVGLSRVARRCTLAFEIAQLELGPTPDHPCLAAARRRAAVDWAALMLITSEEFAAVWAHSIDLSAMAALLEVDVATFRARIRAASDSDQDAVMEIIGQTRLSA